MGGVLPQKGADGVLLPGGPALHHRQIAPAAHQRIPVLLVGPLGLLVFGEQEHAGGVAVQPVDDEHPPSGPGAAHVLPRHAVGGAALGEKPKGYEIGEIWEYIFLDFLAYRSSFTASLARSFCLGLSAICSTN